MAADYELGWMTDMDLLQMLYSYGHFWSPEALEVTFVNEEDLPKLTLHDRVVQAAVRSYQAWFKSDLDRLTLRGEEFGGHRRLANADGEVGVNTEELLTMPRCGMADFPNPHAAVAEASWPESCRNQITTSYRMSLTGITDEQLAQIWQSADGRWQAVLELAFDFRLSDYPNTRIYAFAQRMGGSVLADQYLAQNNCNARLQGRFDTRQWTAALLETTIVHEHGHALGCNHLQNQDATMYPSIHQASMARRGAPNAADIQAMLALGYKRRSTTPPPLPPAGGTQLTLHQITPAGSYRLVQA